MVYFGRVPLTVTALIRGQDISFGFEEAGRLEDYVVRVEQLVNGVEVEGEMGGGELAFGRFNGFDVVVVQFRIKFIEDG